MKMKKAKVGDIWMSEGNDGEIKYHAVIDVVESENDDLIYVRLDALDGRPAAMDAHLGWWHDDQDQGLEDN